MEIIIHQCSYFYDERIINVNKITDPLVGGVPTLECDSFRIDVELLSETMLFFTDITPGYVD